MDVATFEALVLRGEIAVAFGTRNSHLFKLDPIHDDAYAKDHVADLSENRTLATRLRNPNEMFPLFSGNNIDVEGHRTKVRKARLEKEKASETGKIAINLHPPPPQLFLVDFEVSKRNLRIVSAFLCHRRVRQFIETCEPLCIVRQGTTAG